MTAATSTIHSTIQKQVGSNIFYYDSRKEPSYLNGLLNQQNNRINTLSKEILKLNMSKTKAESFEVLGLPLTASEEEIRKAYRQKALELHPDKNHDDPNATERFQDLQEAYQNLVGPEEEEDLIPHEPDIEILTRIFMAMFHRNQFPFGFHERQRYHNPYSDSGETNCNCGRHNTPPRYRNYFDENRKSKNFQTGSKTTGSRNSRSDTGNVEGSDDEDAWLEGLVPSEKTKQYGTKQKVSSKKKKGKHKKKRGPRWATTNKQTRQENAAEDVSSVGNEEAESQEEKSDEDLSTTSSDREHRENGNEKETSSSSKTAPKDKKEHSEHMSNMFDSQEPDEKEQENENDRSSPASNYKTSSKKTKEHTEDMSEKFDSQEPDKKEQEKVKEKLSSPRTSNEKTDNRKSQQSVPKTDMINKNSNSFAKATEQNPSMNNYSKAKNTQNNPKAKSARNKIQENSVANMTKLPGKACNDTQYKGTTSSKLNGAKSNSNETNGESKSATASQQNIPGNMYSKQNRNNAQQSQAVNYSQSSKTAMKDNNKGMVNSPMKHANNTKQSERILPEKATTKQNEMQIPKHDEEPVNKSAQSRKTKKKQSSSNGSLIGQTLFDVKCEVPKSNTANDNDVKLITDRGEIPEQGNQKQPAKKLPSTHDDTFQQGIGQQKDGSVQERSYNARIQQGNTATRKKFKEVPVNGLRTQGKSTTFHNYQENAVRQNNVQERGQDGIPVGHTSRRKETRGEPLMNQTQQVQFGNGVGRESTNQVNTPKPSPPVQKQTAYGGIRTQNVQEESKYQNQPGFYAKEQPTFGGDRMIPPVHEQFARENLQENSTRQNKPEGRNDIKSPTSTNDIKSAKGEKAKKKKNKKKKPSTKGLFISNMFGGNTEVYKSNENNVEDSNPQDLSEKNSRKTSSAKRCNNDTFQQVPANDLKPQANIASSFQVPGQQTGEGLLKPNHFQERQDTASRIQENVTPVNPLQQQNNHNKTNTSNLSYFKNEPQDKAARNVNPNQQYYYDFEQMKYSLNIDRYIDHEAVARRMRLISHARMNWSEG